MQGLGEGIFRLVFFSIPGYDYCLLVFPVKFTWDLQVSGDCLALYSVKFFY